MPRLGSITTWYGLHEYITLQAVNVLITLSPRLITSRYCLINSEFTQMLRLITTTVQHTILFSPPNTLSMPKGLPPKNLNKHFLALHNPVKLTIYNY